MKSRRSGLKKERRRSEVEETSRTNEPKSKTETQKVKVPISLPEFNLVIEKNPQWRVVEYHGHMWTPRVAPAIGKIGLVVPENFTP